MIDRIAHESWRVANEQYVTIRNLKSVFARRYNPAIFSNLIPQNPRTAEYLISIGVSLIDSVIVYRTGMDLLLEEVQS